MKNGKDIVLHPSNGDVSSLAHEIGHSKTKNPVLRKLTKVEDTERKMAQSLINGVDEASTVGESVDRLVRSRSLLAEEKRANKSGLRLLKSAGLPEKDLKKAKEGYKLAENNYRHSSNAYFKKPLLNKIRIKRKEK